MNEYKVKDMLDKELVENEGSELKTDSEMAPTVPVTENEESAGTTLDPVEALDLEVKTLKETVLRQAAEFQNYKRRMDKAQIDAVTIGKTAVIQRLLDVLDDLGRSLDAADSESESGENQSNEALRDGVRLVFQKFQDELSRLGVEPIVAEGVPFNEDEHEAMMQQPAPENVAPGTVLHELQKGYRMGDRILRHSKVVVAT